MLATKCPGQDMRYWTTEDVHEEKCPECGEIIEFFKTDIRLRCQNCKTRVANTRFDMGCAQWCAYAEMCIGPGAKGLNQKTFKDILVEETERLTRGLNESNNLINSMIEQAEEKCRSKKLDALTVTTGIVIISLLKLKLINNPYTYLEELNQKQTFPQEARHRIESLLENVLDNNFEMNRNRGSKEKKTDQTMEDVIYELFNKYDQKIKVLYKHMTSNGGR